MTRLLALCALLCPLVLVGPATTSVPSTSVVGAWKVLPYRSPTRSIHAALLRTGQVLIAAGSGNNQAFFNARSFRTTLWEYPSDRFVEVRTPWDLFCAGHAALADGRLLVAGGTASYTIKGPYGRFAGSRKAYLFDPLTRRYSAVQSMNAARWYPTLTRLGDGSILATAGWDDRGEVVRHSEVFDPATRRWTSHQPEEVFWPTYPSLFLLEDGRLFYSGAQVFGGTNPIPPGFWSYETNEFTPVPGLRAIPQRDHAAAVLLPPAQDERVIVLGGGDQLKGRHAVALADVIDLKEPDPTYRAAPDMARAKMYVSAVILPDRTVFVTGGGLQKRADPVLNAQIYHPDTDTWTEAASPVVGRLYHSVAFLLPDGRVATLGSNPVGSFELRIEVYSPPYLFKGRRPTVKAPPNLAYGASYTLATTQARSIQTVSLLSPAAVTHSMDANQRLVDVPFVTTPGGAQITVPDDSNLAPPGWYMLFVTDAAGVPSVARWVHLA